MMCRAYFFGNMYLSPIQQGIQAGHTIAELSTKYQNAESDYMIWANDHKTMILLNGGMSCNLQNIINHLSNKDNPYNWNFFTESKEALDGALTCVGIILPEKVYENARLLRQSTYNDDVFDATGVSQWELELYSIMNSCRLA